MTEALMWEARAAAGRGAELLDWAREHALPALAGAERAELFSAAGERVLVIGWWSGEPVPVPDPPADLLARPVHRWAFHSESVVSCRTA
ncbi:hypothetical protein C7C46_17195 [Streptomyces tateyamensis]|uniref:Uncharacterized protein n=1 Tax=Streptomyces tateyamensis TaxID=565073 RepID=A0A2V4NPR5_9ACTN|nr:hypothetical protein [Streptomyces tateyamensis]PYC78068.1 hypothetical protein C7C46_17195 [Streptomyces tateyamensis]